MSPVSCRVRTSSVNEASVRSHPAVSPPAIDRLVRPSVAHRSQLRANRTTAKGCLVALHLEKLRIESRMSAPLRSCSCSRERVLVQSRTGSVPPAAASNHARRAQSTSLPASSPPGRTTARLAEHSSSPQMMVPAAARGMPMVIQASARRADEEQPHRPVDACPDITARALGQMTQRISSSFVAGSPVSVVTNTNRPFAARSPCVEIGDWIRLSPGTSAGRVCKVAVPHERRECAGNGARRP